MVVVSTAEAAVEDSTEAAVAVPMVVAGSVAVAAVPVGARGLSEEALTEAEGFAADPLAADTAEDPWAGIEARQVVAFAADMAAIDTAVTAGTVTVAIHTRLG